MKAEDRRFWPRAWALFVCISGVAMVGKQAVNDPHESWFVLLWAIVGIGYHFTERVL